MSLDIKICTISLPFLAIFLVSYVHGSPKIVKPYPNNVYAIENEKTAITCVVEDTEAGTNPDRIAFVRKSRYGDIFPINDEGPGGRIYYKNESLDGGKKLQVSLNFNKVLLIDDSRNGGYECQGYTGANQHEYGFTVTVIERSEIPGIEVSKNISAEFGDKIQLSCNLTLSLQGNSAEQTELSKLLWAKEGKLIAEVLYPREQSLKSLKIDIDSADKGGIYTCHLTSKLRRVKYYNVTDSIYVSVKPEFFAEDLKDNQVLKYKGKEAKFVCSAEGNPLQTEWKSKVKTADKATFIDAGNSSGFELENMDKFRGHTLIIKKVDYLHRGRYYCCIKDANTTRKEDDIHNCQVFTLRVKDPLGPLWPVIGIIIEVILLIIIIYGSEKLKDRKKKSAKADDHVDFSYSSTDDNGDKGHVRLRQTGDTAPSDAEKA